MRVDNVRGYILRVWPNSLKKSWVLYAAMSLVVCIFFWQYLATGSKTSGGDFDYYAQLYEAFRITVLKFHQLPLWNPWMAGGLPLFANPQFGMFSIQSLFVLVFGAIYGIKLAYIAYALIGFWGMYAVGRKILDASRIRSALISYIWVFGGFFAFHGAVHLTFTSFFFLPWFLFFIARRRHKYSWLGLGIVESMIILSSMHYALLMLTLTMAIYFVISLTRARVNTSALKLYWELKRADVFFVLKAAAVVIVIAGYQFYMTYSFESHNQRVTPAFTEPSNSVGLLIQALFLPIGTVLSYPKTTWLWGEYSAYLGMATGIALLVCILSLGYALIKRRASKITNRTTVASLLVIGMLAAVLAMGDFGKISPFYMLHALPGFTQTRVPSRWLIITAFSILVLLLAWRRNKKIINLLLFLSVLELFLTNGPPRIMGQSEYNLPPAKFSDTFSQYDNGKSHMGALGDTKIAHSYYFATAENKGQVYADDSLINTLSADPPLKTGRCGLNVNTACKLIQTPNAALVFWSPNKIIIRRTASGPIKLNMNVESGWRVNKIYPFAGISSLQPSLDFMLTDHSPTYTLEYAPKLSPSWLVWRIQQL